ncbi:MAG TPA: DNA-binding domain-containing protein [Candidatus Acidoferrales bacterium]|nr:DNA-binding domain-containing protein [Candidatus Acidoferrales bacterium]
MPVHLEQLEGLLYRLITAVSGVGEGLASERSLPAGGLGAIVLGDERLSPEARVDIYANMYFYRLLDVLKEDFPATHAVLGDDNFHNLATGYLIEYPPTEPSVYHLGRHLADFLRDHPMRENAPFIVDLAALERATVEVFQAADACALDAESMRAIPGERWPAMKLATHPAVQILSLEWRVAELLRAVEDHREWTPAQAGAASVIVWRRDSRVFYRELEPVECRALQAALGGATFAEICELVAADSDQQDPIGEINRLLARWLSDSIFQLLP